MPIVETRLAVKAIIHVSNGFVSVSRGDSHHETLWLLLAHASVVIRRKKNICIVAAAAHNFHRLLTIKEIPDRKDHLLNTKQCWNSLWDSV